MVRCPKCGYDLDRPKSAEREEAEKIFNLAIEGKKKEIKKFISADSNLDLYGMDWKAIKNAGMDWKAIKNARVKK